MTGGQIAISGLLSWLLPAGFLWWRRCAVMVREWRRDGSCFALSTYVFGCPAERTTCSCWEEFVVGALMLGLAWPFRVLALPFVLSWCGLRFLGHLSIRRAMRLGDRDRELVMERQEMRRAKVAEIRAFVVENENELEAIGLPFDEAIRLLSPP